MNLDQELIRHIIYTANEAGFRGVKIVDWIPPLKTVDDRFGTFVYTIKEKKNGM